MRVLITGASGFTGAHLSEFLSRRKNIELYGTSQHRRTRKGIRFFACDLRDAKKTAALIEKIRPERIFHLAAQSSVALSWEKPKESFDHNVGGTLNLLEAIKKAGLRPAILVSGSAEEYGRCNSPRITETAVLKPVNPYASSKLAQSALVARYSETLGFRFVQSRTFNLTGPGQNENFVASSFAKQVSLIEAGKQEAVIQVGNLEAVRDFTDVRDAVRAYWLMIEKGISGQAYNICSGKGRKVSEILDGYLSLSRVKIKIRKDPRRMRASDVPRLVGDPKKIAKQTGWKPEISFEKTLKDVLNYWRMQVK